MKRIIVLLAVLLTAQVSFAQNTFTATAKDRQTREAVAGAKVSVKGTEISATTGADGVARLEGIPTASRPSKFSRPATRQAN